LNTRHAPSVLSVCIVCCTLACGSNPTGPPASVLEPVVARDGIPFNGQAIPEGVLDRLSPYRVVMVGETHHLTEHREMMAALVRDLHARGFRQLMMELPHMADWLLVDYVLDGGAVPGWEPPLVLGGELITAVRDFNRSLPETDRVLVRGIDVNLDDYGGAESFLDLIGWYSEQLPDPGPIETFLAAPYATPANQAAAIEQLQDDLQSQRADLVATWGEQAFETVAEMVEVERTSVTIRADRDAHYDATVRERERIIKELCDTRIEETPHGTLINIGGNHAQKTRMKGTELEWLGDYLVNRSPVVNGSIIVLVVTAARIVSPDGGTTLYDLGASPPNELFRLMNETWPSHTVFLPLDDPIFSGQGVLVNFESELYSSALKRVYDVAVLLPLARRDPGM